MKGSNIAANAFRRLPPVLGRIEQEVASTSILVDLVKPQESLRHAGCFYLFCASRIIPFAPTR